LPDQGWTIAADRVQTRFNRTDGQDPIFRIQLRSQHRYLNALWEAARIQPVDKPRPDSDRDRSSC
jgi:hypothetical protein